jgi:hypothetical protein
VANDDIPRLVSGLDGHKGLVMSLEDVEVAIARVRIKLEARGLQPLGGEGTISRVSLTNCMAIIHANVKGVRGSPCRSVLRTVHSVV